MEKEIIMVQLHKSDNPVVYVQDNTKFYEKYFKFKEDCVRQVKMLAKGPQKG
jgi:hypothetical protein